MSPFSYKAKLALIKRAAFGVKVASLCRESGVSRKTFYAWLKKYRKSKPNLAHLTLSDKRFKAKVSLKALEVDKKLLLINNVLNAKKVKAESREETLSLKRLKVAHLCRENGISRKTFYKWLKRYQTEGNNGLFERRLKGFEHPKSIGEETRRKILEFIALNPDLSVHKLAKSLDFVGHHGIQNILSREGLNTLAKRLTFALGFAPEPKVRVAPLYRPQMPVWRLRQIIAPFTTIPKLFLIKPKAAAFRLVFLLLPFFVTTLWIRVLFRTVGVSHAGLIFASIALFFGLFFFIYSLKYYISIVMVLKLAQSGAGSGESGVMGTEVLEVAKENDKV